MIGYRIVVVVLLAAFTACITCSSLFPLFRTSVTSSGGTVTTIAYYYWYVEESRQSSSKMWTVQRLYTRDIGCSRMLTYYVWSASLAVATAGFGGLATLLGAAWVSVGYSVGLSVLVFLLTLLGFACAGAGVGLMGYAYSNEFCASSPYAAARSPQASGFSMVEGFILLCVAVGGFAILLLMQAIGFCCGCQTGKKVKPRLPLRAAPRDDSHEPVEARQRRAERPFQQRRVVVAEDAERVHGQQRHSPDSTEAYYPYPAKN